MKLLVVYGDEAYCLRLCECLKEMDAFCVEEPLFDASAAIARAKVAMPDIVIADMQLSGMEAMELLDSLRRECGAKTVACSSVHNESAALTAMQHGADYFVAKPIPPCIYGACELRARASGGAFANETRDRACGACVQKAFAARNNAENEGL